MLSGAIRNALSFAGSTGKSRATRTYASRISPLLITLFLILLPVASAQAQDSREYSVKAAYLYNFAKFIEWPKSDKVLDICVLGDNPFGNSLRLLEKEKAGDRAIRVYNKTTRDTIGRCDMIFISKSSDALDDIFAYLRGKPVLTVGESDDFARTGGMIGFVMVHGRVKLEINSGAIAAAGLTVDPTLLEIAVNVVGG